MNKLDFIITQTKLGCIISHQQPSNHSNHDVAVFINTKDILMNDSKKKRKCYGYRKSSRFNYIAVDFSQSDYHLFPRLQKYIFLLFRNYVRRDVKPESFDFYQDIETLDHRWSKCTNSCLILFHEFFSPCSELRNKFIVFN